MGRRTDEQLWHSAVRGDGDAFGEIYERHADAIYNYLFRRTANWAVAEDLTSSVFAVAWFKRARVQFTDDQRLLPWLYGVAANVLRNHDRGVNRTARALTRYVRGHVRHVEPDVAEKASEQAQMRAVLDAARKLPRIEREVLLLCVAGDVSYGDAALALGIPVGTVRSRLSRARTRLRELSDSFGQEHSAHPRPKVEAHDGT